MACGDRLSSSSPKRASRSGPAMARRGHRHIMKCEHRRFGPIINVAVAHLDSCHAANVKYVDSD